MFIGGLYFDVNQIMVRIYSREDTQQRRAFYTRELRRDFRNSVKEIFGNVQTEEYLEIHHKYPQQFGYGSEFSNLAMVERQIHVGIHQFINAQTRGYKAGDRLLVNIPTRPDRLWISPNEKWRIDLVANLRNNAP